MGFFSSKPEPIDQDVMDKATICNIKLIADMLASCETELQNENLSSVEKLMIEVNKQNVINKGVELLKQLEHKETIKVNKDDKHHYIFTENDVANIENFTQYTLK
ncbi:hypothetical protein VP14_173 [Vibrio phage VPMCC14]|nr:hypothetical protein VP14_173 [Vibrio phage VPMCC14]